MSVFVVDASVVLKWYLREVHTDPARGLLAGGHELHAPDFLLLEVDNVLCTRVRRGEIDREHADVSRDAIRKVAMKLWPFEPLQDGAYDIAAGYRRSVYDGLYLALAQYLGCPLVTADRRLVNALAGGPLADLLLWVEDVP